MTRPTLVTFNACWNNHPDIADGEHNPCRNADGEPSYYNECAVRMGVTLKRAGVVVPIKPKGFDRLAHCSHGHKGEQHVLRAEVLAKWMKKQVKHFGKIEKKIGFKHNRNKGVDWTHFQDRVGIVFFKDFWWRVKKRDADGNPLEYEKWMTGDHIDVWNGFNQAGDDSGPMGVNNEYFERSKQIWFWELPDDGSGIATV